MKTETNNPDLPSEPEKIIKAGIAQRIKDEFRKHGDIEWEEIAASKIYQAFFQQPSTVDNNEKALKKTRTKYLCCLCEMEYNSPKEAERCTLLGIPPETADYKVGEEISFEREERGDPMGSFITYVRDKGTILHKVVSFNEQSNTHQEIMLVDTEKGERGVIAINLEGEGVKLMSPAPYNYNKGFAEIIKQKQQ